MTGFDFSPDTTYNSENGHERTMVLTFRGTSRLPVHDPVYVRFVGWTPFVTRLECRIARAALRKLAWAASDDRPDEVLFDENAARIHRIASGLYDVMMVRDGRLTIRESDIPAMRANVAA